MCGIDEGIAHILTGFNALLNKDFVRVHDMFDFPQFKEEIDDIDLVHAVIKLGSGKWNDESIQKLMKEIIISQNLYSNHNTDDKITELSKSVEFSLIKLIIKATNGDMQSLGQVCDHIFFNNRSWVCTLFSVMNEGKLTMTNI